MTVAIFTGLERLFGRLAIGHVAKMHHDGVDAGFVEQIASHAFGPADVAVLVAAAEPAAAGRAGIVEQLPHESVPGIAIDGLHEVPRAQPDHIPCGIADHGLDRGVGPPMMPSASTSTTASMLNSISDAS